MNTGDRLKRLKRKVQEAQTNEELAVALAEEAKDDGDRLEHGAQPAVIATVGVAGLAALAFWAANTGHAGFGLAWTVAAIAIGAGAYAFYLHDRWSKVENLVNEVYQNNLAGLTPVSTSAESLSAFGEYQRGNYSREIRRVALGSREVNGEKLAFSAVDYHWVNEVRWVETYTDQNGNVRQRQRVRYDHFDRSGISVKVGVFGPVAIFQNDGFARPTTSWTTADPRFNKHFEVACQREMDAATILKPAVVDRLVEFTELARGVNIEFNGAGRMLVSFWPTNLFATEGPAPSILRLAEAADIVRSEATQPLLDAFFEVVAEVHRHARRAR